MHRLIAAGLIALTPGCAGFATAPPPVPTQYLGCFGVELGRIGSFFPDSLGYAAPRSVRLTETELNIGRVRSSGFRAMRVLPSDVHYPPYWTQLDRLPSTHARRAARESNTPQIPADSIDLYFHGPVGNLVLRVALDGQGNLSGRAEWITLDEYPVMPQEGAVTLRPQRCANQASPIAGFFKTLQRRNEVSCVESAEVL